MYKKQFKIIELPEMVGKTLEQVKCFLEENYKDGQLAQETDREDFIESNPSVPDWTWCFFFGSTLRNSNGHWSVPCAYWNGSAWSRYAHWLDDVWNSDYRVVLLDDSVADCPVESDLTLDSLNLRLEKLEKLFRPNLLS